MYVDVYISSIHNCTTLEATNMSFEMCMGKQTVVGIYIHMQWNLNDKKKYAAKPQKDI